MQESQVGFFQLLQFACSVMFLRRSFKAVKKLAIIRSLAFFGSLVTTDWAVHSVRTAQAVSLSLLEASYTIYTFLALPLPTYCCSVDNLYSPQHVRPVPPVGV